MPSRREPVSNSGASRGAPGKTPEAREAQLVAAAVELAEKQLLAGTASSQVITHYLKLGSSTERLLQERLRNENRLTEAKIEDLGSRKETEAMYREALRAMSAYSGNVVQGEIEDDPDL